MQYSHDSTTSTPDDNPHLPHQTHTTRNMLLMMGLLTLSDCAPRLGANDNWVPNYYSSTPNPLNGNCLALDMCLD